MKREKVGFEEMPFILADLVNQVKELTAKVDHISIAPQPSNGRKIIMTQEVCRMLGLTPVTVYRMVKRGQLSATKKGKSWYFFEDEVVKMIERGRTMSTLEIEHLADEYLRSSAV